jgi:NAD(P)-dependent dehydrogenase (short-subunit alcohol dehydrogenase family)
MGTSLAGKVALVAGATRGAGRGIAVQLGAAGATVYVTGRTSGSERSEMNRPETIEETAALVDEAGGRGIAVKTDHLVPDEVRALVTRIEGEQGALHVLVNDIWGATTMEWNKSVWESSLDIGLRTLRLAVDTHAITSHFALPLLIRTPGGLVVEVTDGTDEYNAANYRVSFFYDLAKAAVNRMAFALAHELRPYGATAVSLTPGWLRSEAMLNAYGVSESNWRDATKRSPHFAISESPAFVGRAVAALAQDPDVSRWNGKSLSSGQLAKIYGFTDLDGSQPDAWRYVVESRTQASPPTSPAIAEPAKRTPFGRTVSLPGGPVARGDIRASFALRSPTPVGRLAAPLPPRRSRSSCRSARARSGRTSDAPRRRGCR